MAAARLRPVLVCAALALSASAAGAATEPALDADRALAASQAAIGRKPGDYAFRAHGERQVRLADYRGKPLLVSFVYTGCTSACPLDTQQLARTVTQAQAVVGADAFRVLSIGFNLPHDTPEAMRDHARRFGLVRPGWDFVAAYEPQVRSLTRELGFSYVPTSWGFDHISQVTILDAEGRIYRQVYGEFPIQRVIDPLKELIEGTPVPLATLAGLVDRVRLLCTVYDPRTNRYRFKTTIVAEIVSFAGITIALGWFVWRERRRRRGR